MTRWHSLFELAYERLSRQLSREESRLLAKPTLKWVTSVAGPLVTSLALVPSRDHHGEESPHHEQTLKKKKKKKQNQNVGMAPKKLLFQTCLGTTHS